MMVCVYVRVRVSVSVCLIKVKMLTITLGSQPCPLFHGSNWIGQHRREITEWVDHKIINTLSYIKHFFLVKLQSIESIPQGVPSIHTPFA